jgi:hypothetical protein
MPHKPFMLESQRQNQPRPTRREFLTRKEMQDQIKILLNSQFAGNIEPWAWNDSLGYVVDTESVALLNVQPIPEQQSLCSQLEGFFSRVKKSKEMLSIEEKGELQTLVNSLYDLEEMAHSDMPSDEEIEEMYNAMNDIPAYPGLPSALAKTMFIGGRVGPMAEPGDKEFTLEAVQHPAPELGRIPEPVAYHEDTLANVRPITVDWIETE